MFFEHLVAFNNRELEWWVILCNCSTFCSPFKKVFGYGSIPIDSIFRGLFTSINPSYFDVHYRGIVQGFWPIPIWCYWHWASIFFAICGIKKNRDIWERRLHDRSTPSARCAVETGLSCLRGQLCFATDVVGTEVWINLRYRYHIYILVV